MSHTVTSFRIPAETQRLLNAHCKKHGLVVGAFVSEAIEAHIEGSGRALRELVREIVREEIDREKRPF